MVISVELDNGSNAMFDEGKTEKVRDDFSADATNVGFNCMDCALCYLSKRIWQAILDVLKTKKNNTRSFNQLNYSLVIYKINVYFKWFLASETQPEREWKCDFAHKQPQ